mmetsp:Transcript_15207/g.28008  ORF Transcript_15207/g.28008 Transcript_15207/m.28008 type:complete len:232 (-) Transcript_15207:1014-1709(-)
MIFSFSSSCLSCVSLSLFGWALLSPPSTLLPFQELPEVFLGRVAALLSFLRRVPPLMPPWNQSSFETLAPRRKKKKKSCGSPCGWRPWSSPPVPSLPFLVPRYYATRLLPAFRLPLCSMSFWTTESNRRSPTPYLSGRNKSPTPWYDFPLIRLPGIWKYVYLVAAKPRHPLSGAPPECIRCRRFPAPRGELSPAGLSRVFLRRTDHAFLFGEAPSLCLLFLERSFELVPSW